MADRDGTRVAYDRVWGTLLALTCILPGADAWGAGEPWVVRSWLALAAVGALAATILGFAGWRSRWRHFSSFAFGVALLSIPLFAPIVWERYPYANPARLPFRALGSVGWVMLVALTAIYAGSGIRIVRPSHISGQALAALGALLLAVFAFLPVGGEEQVFALERFRQLFSFHERWRPLVPFCLVASAVLFAALTLVRSRAEVFLARLARLCLVAALLFWLSLPFREKGGALTEHLPVAWGALRFFAPLFLALDGCIAFVAISIARG